MLLVKNVVLPLAIFPALSVLAWYFIFGHMHHSGLDVTMMSGCSPLSGVTMPYRRHYTSFSYIDDHILCPLVAFFHAAMESPDAKTFLTYFLGIGAPLGVIPIVESWRANRSRYIAFPVLFGLLSQTLTVGVTMPFYWLIFIMSGGTNTVRGDATVTQAHAEAIVFGIVIGAAIPSVAMLILKDPQVTAIWQPFPVYISIAQFVHLAFRPASKHSQSGYITIRALYLGMFIIGSSTHITTIWPLLKDTDTIDNIFLPSLYVPTPSNSMAIRVLHFLKWDLTFGLASSILATLWFARNLKDFIALVIWNAVATLVLGPGAALTGAALWRESWLQHEPGTKIKNVKKL